MQGARLGRPAALEEGDDCPDLAVAQRIRETRHAPRGDAMLDDAEEGKMAGGHAVRRGRSSMRSSSTPNRRTRT